MGLPISSLGLGVLQDYNNLRAETQSKNIAAWTPVVAEILEGFCHFDDKAVSAYHIILFHECSRWPPGSLQGIYPLFIPMQQIFFLEKPLRKCGRH